MKTAFLIMFPAMFLMMVFCGDVHAITASEQYRLAYEAEKKGDFESALLHWETLQDSFDMDPAMRHVVVEHIRELRPKVKVDPEKKPSNTWKCLVLVYRNIDFEFTGADGEKKHVRTTMSDAEIEEVRRGMNNFAEHVINYTSRELAIEYEMRVIDRTLSNLVGEKSFWLSPGEAEKDMKKTDDHAWDNVFAFTRFQQEKDQPGIPAAFGGGALGADAGAMGCGYINIILWKDGLKEGARDGEIELHEWLHVVDWMFTAVQGYPDSICPSSDDGRKEGDFGGDPHFRRSAVMDNWMPFYAHIMQDHITGSMWRNASIHRIAETPWSYAGIGEWLVIGPFKKTGGKTFDTAFIDEENVEPSPVRKDGGKEWKRVEVSGPVLNLDALFDPNEEVVAYAHLYVFSEKEQRAQLRIGSDDGAAVWVNRRLVYYADAPRPLRMDENIVDIKLRQGWNRVLFKVDEVSGGWGLTARFAGPDGQKIDGLKYGIRPPK